MKLSKIPMIGTAVSVVFAGAVVLAPAATAAQPTWEPDINGNGGTISFYDAAGHQVTSGNDLSHLFDYAVASTAEDPAGFHRAFLAFAYPNHAQTTDLWFVNGGSLATIYPVASAPGDLAAVPATTPVSHPAATDMNLTASLGAATLDTTPGYANVVQIRMQQSGSSASYDTADISYDTVAGTWTEIYPASSSSVSTSIALSASPVGSQTGGSPVTFTATVTPAGAVGSVQFKDGSTNVGPPVNVASGTAKFVTSALAAGVHSLTAAFSPTDAGAFSASASSALAYAVHDTSALTISASTTVKYGSATVTSTTLKDTRTGHVLAAVPVKLYRRPSTSTVWSLLGTVTTASTGKASKSVVATGRTFYQWRYDGNSAHKAAVSAAQTVAVAQVVSARATKTSVRHGSTIKIYGTVRPSSSGQRVILQHLVGRTWRNGPAATIKRQKLPNGVTTIGYVFSIKLAAKGTYRYRVEKAGTTTLAAGFSATATVRAT